VVVIVLTFAPAGLKPVTQTYIVTQATGTITISLSNSNVYWAVWLDDGTTATFVDCTIYSLQLSVCLPHMSIKFLGWKRFHSNIQIKKSEGYYRKTGSWLFLGWYKSSILHPRLEAKKIEMQLLDSSRHGYNGACHFNIGNFLEVTILLSDIVWRWNIHHSQRHMMSNLFLFQMEKIIFNTFEYFKKENARLCIGGMELYGQLCE